MRKWAIGLVVLAAGCLSPKAQMMASNQVIVPPDFMFTDLGPAPEVPAARYMGKFKTTFYWVVEEKDYPQSRSVPLYDESGSLVGKFPGAFVQDFKREAAAKLADGRCISYLKKANRVKVGDKFLGTNGFCLTELKSIAVDPRVIPLGSLVYIPQAASVVVDGKRLTGVFRAHDIGSAVQGKHIDIFVGSKGNCDAFQSAGVRSTGSVDVYILE
jgi:3D (Asp-Asp-Asp) domain-containing protein